MSKLSVVLRASTGAARPNLRVRVKNVDTDAYVLDTDDNTLVDNGDGSYTSATDVSAMVYSVYTGDTATLVNGYEERFHPGEGEELDQKITATEVTFTPTTAPTSSEGKVYYDETDNAVKVYNGSVWERISNDGAIDVRDYGAVGDGVTDDTAAFQSAMTALGYFNHDNAFSNLNLVTGGGEIFVPDGEYLITSSLKFSAGTKVRGAGWGTVINFKPSSLDNLFELDSTREYPTYANGQTVEFRDLVVISDLQSAVDVIGNQYGNIMFDFTGCHFTRLHKVKIQNCRNGVKYGGSSTPGYYQTIDQCYFYNCGELAIDVDTYGGPVTMIGGDITSSGGFYPNLVGGAGIPQPEYALRTKAQLTMIDVGIEMFDGPSVAYIHESGAEGICRIHSGRFETYSGLPLKYCDATYHLTHIHTMNDAYITGSRLAFDDIFAREEGEDGSVPGRRFGPIDSYGTPVPVHLYMTDAGGNSVLANNYDMRKQFWGFTYNAAAATMTYDTSTKFLNDGCVKIVYDKGTTITGLTQTFSYPQVEKYAGRRLFYAVIMKLENSSDFSSFGVKVYQANQTSEYKYADAGDGGRAYLVDYGNGFKLYVVDFMVTEDQSGTDDDLKIEIQGAVGNASSPHGTVYIAYAGLFEGGYPILPTSVGMKTPFETASDAAPTYANYKSGFAVGDRIWNINPTASTATNMGWICTTAGTTFSAFGDIA